MFASPRAGEQILLTRKPIGVVAVITPFNFPIAIPAWKIAPALVYGNTVVWKPASTVPLLALRLADALTAAGLPRGVLNLVIGGSSVGDALVTRPGVDAITFTGSTRVGRRIAAAAAARGVPVQAEMGGKNAAVVSSRRWWRVRRTWRWEIPVTTRRRWVRSSATRRRPVSRPVIGAATAQGAAVLTGGGPYRDGPLAEGYFIAPTVVELTQPADIWAEELFGPVLAVRRATDADEAFELANDSEFGLSAAVFTQDLTRVLQAVEHVDVGVLHVNSESAGADPHVPFGGAKKSGLGPKEQGGAAREFFTHTTTVYLRGGQAGA